MATIRLKFRPSAVTGKTGALVYQVTHRRVVRVIRTEIRIYPDEWDGVSASIRIQGNAERREQLRMARSRVEWQMRQMASLIAETEKRGREYTVDELLAAFRRLPPYQTWFSFIENRIAQKETMQRKGTALSYSHALRSFAAFRGGRDIAVAELDSSLMDAYEAWLKLRGLRRNSSACYLRTLRTLYHSAIEAGLTEDRRIFRHVFTGTVRTARRAIPVRHLGTIRRLDLPDGSSLAFVRDLFLLSFYLRGMSFVDMAYLRKSDLRDGLLHYNRKKTGQSLTIEWLPPMQEIADRYAPQTAGSPYLLPIIRKPGGNERIQYLTMEQKANRILKKIAAMAGLRLPLTTYVARHTWATTARDIGCPLSVISEGLGHDSLKTTQTYLASIDLSAVDKANREIMELLR